MLLKKSIIAALLICAVLAPQLHAALSMQELPSLAAFINQQEIFSIPTAEAAAANRGVSAVPKVVGEVLSFVLSFFVIVNWIALSGAQALMDNDVIFGEIIPVGLPNAGSRPMELILKNLWLVSRDIVNGIFAFILLFAGIYMIMKANNDALSKIKQAAPKFVLAVILVNFSWFFPRVILDMANVLTSVIYQLPVLVDPSMPCKGERLPGPDNVIDTVDDIFPCRYVYHVKLFPPTERECLQNPAQDYCPHPSDPPLAGGDLGKYLYLVSIYYQNWSAVANNGYYFDLLGPDQTVQIPVSGADVVMNGMAVNFAKMINFGEVDFQKFQSAAANTSSLLDQARLALKILVYLLFNVALSLAVGLALLAFMAVLIVRMAVLWMCIAFMPFIFVGYALGGNLGEVNVGSEQSVPNIWKKFIQYAFLPVFVAVPFSVGFALLSQLYNIKAMNINIEIDGIEELISGIANMHELLWMIITIGIIWVGVFNALKADTFAAKITGGIKSFGNNLAGIVPKTLGYTRIGPLPSVLGVRDAVSNASYSRKGIQDFGLRPRGPGSPVTGAAPPPETRHVVDHLNANPRAAGDYKNLISALDGRNAAPQMRKLYDLIKGMPNMNDAAAYETALNPESHREIASKVAEVEPADVHNATRHIQITATSMNHINMGSLRETKTIPQNATAAGEATAEKIGSKTVEQLRDSLKNHIDFAGPHSNVGVGIQKALEKVEEAIRNNGANTNLNNTQLEDLKTKLESL